VVRGGQGKVGVELELFNLLAFFEGAEASLGVVALRTLFCFFAGLGLSVTPIL